MVLINLLHPCLFKSIKYNVQNAVEIQWKLSIIEDRCRKIKKNLKMIYLLPNQIQKIDVYVESKLLLMVLVEVHTPRAQSLHSRLGNRGSDSVAGSPQPETDCVTAANAKV